MAYNPSSQGILQHLEQAERLKLAGKHEDALSLLENLLAQDPENVTVLEEIADNELSLDRLERAERAANQALKLDKSSYTALYILGFILSNKQKWKDATKHLQKANKLKGNNAEILRCLGWALFNNKQQPEGVVTLERSLNLDDDSVMTLCDLGMAYMQMHHTKKAKGLFARSLELEPENNRAKQCLEATEQIEKHLDAIKRETEKSNSAEGKVVQ